MLVFDPYDWDTQQDPYPVYRRLRDEAPCYHNEAQGFWALSRYDDVLSGFRDWENLSNAGGVALEQDDGMQVRQVLSFLGMDPPEHDNLRALVSRAFTPRRVSELEPHVRSLARHYLDALGEGRECDFIGGFAGRLPMDVISELLGIPEDDREMLRTWADTVVHREDGQSGVPAEGIQAAVDILGYFRDHVAGRRSRAGSDDLTDALLAAEVEGKRLADFDVIAFLFLMIIAGNETTTKLLGNALYWAWRHPEQRRTLQADPSRIAGWVEETLRFDPSSQLIARTTTTDLEIHGRQIPKNAKVALLIGSANRDERYWNEPDRYDVGRNTTGSLAFGQGTHFCLGASLARLEARVALEEVLQRAPEYEIVEAGATRIHSANVRGFAALPVRLDP